MSIEKNLADEVVSIIQTERDRAYHKGFTKGIQHAIEKDATENVRTMLPQPEETSSIETEDSYLLGVYQAYEKYADAVERYQMELESTARDQLKKSILSRGTELITAVTTHLDMIGFDEDARILAQISVNEANHPEEEGRLHE